MLKYRGSRKSLKAANIPGRQTILLIQKELEETRKLLEEKVFKIANLKPESITRSQKFGQIEIFLGKGNKKISMLEKEFKKSNEDIVKREMENLNLKSQIEEFEKSKTALQNDIKSEQSLREIKQSYEELSWKHIAEISSLKQDKADA